MFLYSKVSGISLIWSQRYCAIAELKPLTGWFKQLYGYFESIIAPKQAIDVGGGYDATATIITSFMMIPLLK